MNQSLQQAKRKNLKIMCQVWIYFINIYIYLFIKKIHLVLQKSNYFLGDQPKNKKQKIDEPMKENPTGLQGNHEKVIII
jgi:hypothetical protein